MLNILLEMSGEIANEEADQSRNNVQLWMYLVVKIKSDAINKNIA